MKATRKPGMLSNGAAEQLSLDLGMPPPAKKPSASRWSHRDNLFFAILPDPAAIASIEALTETLRVRHGLPGPARPAAVLHVSLTAVGAYARLPAKVVSDARRAGNHVDVAPFEVRFDRVLSFQGGGKRPLVLRCGDGAGSLTKLRRSLGVAMGNAGLTTAVPSGFTPHVTLLYDRKSVAEVFLDQPISWIVRDFVLIHSLQGQCRHLRLDGWPLRGDPTGPTARPADGFGDFPAAPLDLATPLRARTTDRSGRPRGFRRLSPAITAPAASVSRERT
jgi:2'-5' RNA ligase